jgi:hypothetical protein
MVSDALAVDEPQAGKKQNPRQETNVVGIKQEAFLARSLRQDSFA